MKNKLKPRKKFILLSILSLVISCNIFTTPAYAGTYWYRTDYGHGTFHGGQSKWVTSATAANEKCTYIYLWGERCSYVYGGYNYDNPSVSLTLQNPNSVTTQNGIIAFEEGVELSKGSSYFTTTASHNDSGAPFADTINSHQAKVGTLPTENLLTSSSIKLLDLPQDMHTLSVTATDTYYSTTNVAAASKSFYIGPYPTVYFNAHLTDNNQSDHHDTIKIDNIKLLSTYEPESLTIYIYANGKCQTATVSRSGKPTDYVVNGTAIGYISKFDSITIEHQNSNLDNIVPSTAPYIMVKVNDGRSGTSNYPTNPKVAKFAKFNNLPIFATIWYKSTYKRKDDN